MARIFTIGYEQATQAQVIGALKAAGVKLVIDVRAVAASRRAGFSKGVLSASLKDEGLDYLHFKALGTPKAGREAARAGKTEVMREIFEAHLDEPEAVAALAEATRIAEARPAALLCFEAEACRCHRVIVAGEIRQRLGCEVIDL